MEVPLAEKPWKLISAKLRSELNKKWGHSVFSLFSEGRLNPSKGRLRFHGIDPVEVGIRLRVAKEMCTSLGLKSAHILAEQPGQRLLIGWDHSELEAEQI